ncbi:DUF2795 domain-containing protein [Actinoplanes utahensis]|uniref:DUF2795 domain-containing protein n=1 Tax=Actinoplanes utahensis TaxID=1869 RepID=A0A0A6X7N0_ACTUT|nr:DUF2795 domain-containing protein [Actinoplanes utahensis]KHD76137.1 hypothetical protein MB27_18525 [Actinoplanes utahensis]GIF28644.1 hypothetical protein Aut01nite_16300 [Actinoplanes utahensis]
MERVSTKHGAILDEQMARESPRLAEAPPGGYGRDVPDGVGSPHGEAFSRFGTYIGLSAFPGDRAALERSARALEAPDDVMRRLSALPDGTVYENVAQVWDASEGRNA